MSFDSSRFTFNPWNDFSGVVMEQGRVQLDSDWNEWLAELTRRIRAGTLDTLGRAVYPSTTPNAFLITPAAGSVTIGVGRMYVDGLLAENHGLPAPSSGGWIPPNAPAPGAQPAWDPALDELVGQNPIDYTQQPYFPNASVFAPFPTSGGPYLIYLDVWQRELTYLEDPDLVEKAVGVDTTGRLQIAWQVRWLDVSSVGNVTCDSEIRSWELLIRPSGGRLTTGVVASTAEGPCCLAPNTGYTGLENQLYRVEIHQGGSASSKPAGSFVWSRDNVSVESVVTEITPGTNTSGNPASQLTVQSLGRDQVLGFAVGNWIELTDDWQELNGQPGELHKVDSINLGALSITLDSPVSSAFPSSGPTDPARHTRIRRWDQSGKIYQSDGVTVWADLDAANRGDIPLPPAGTSLILENGVTVSFALDASGTAFKVGDYWNFAARTVDGTVENLVEAPPRGIHHHYARLAILTLPDGVTDCRVEWPPASGGGGGCDCGSCVTAQSHNDGSWTIQNGIDAVMAQGGGKVCLGPGVYNIAQTIVIAGANQAAQNIALCGHGLPTLLPTSSFGGSTILEIADAIDIDVDGIAFAGGAPTPGAAGGLSTVAGITIGQSAFVRVERCSFGLVTDIAPLSPAIAFAGGALLDCAIRGNLFNNVNLAIGLLGADAYLLSQLDVEDNQMYCLEGAVFLSAPTALTVSGVRFAKNFVQSTSGFVLLGYGMDVAIEDNSFSIVAATASQNGPYDAAVVCSVSQTRIVNNEISRYTEALSASATTTQGPLAAGTYTWVVTALDASGRESLITVPWELALTGPFDVLLQWAAVLGATSYNIYRSVVNGSTLLLDGTVAAGSGPIISYTDNVADGNLQSQLPIMQNDGIVLGAASSNSILYGTQIIGNRINLLNGGGISSLSNAILFETIIAQNQLLYLGGNGIVLGGYALDTDISRNSLLYVGQFGIREKLVAGIQLQAALNANLSENKIENLGPPTGVSGVGRRGIYVPTASDLRIAGNRIVDVGPTTTTSGGIFAEALNRLDVADNEVRRASTPPAQPDQSMWLALLLFGVNISVQGNALESFGGDGQFPGAVQISAQNSCIFSNNQCFLDDPAGSAQILVATIGAQSIIAMGNLVQGPKKSYDPATLPSLALTVSTTDKIPPATVLGNMTSSGITVNGNPLGAPWAPLNIMLP